MPVTRTLSTYSAFLYPNEGRQYGRINLHCGDHRLYLIFKDPTLALNPNAFNAVDNIGRADLPFSLYEHYLDLIRNERPIRVLFRPEDAPPRFIVYCSGETPGEGEI
ncbi:MAG: hypothetical protein ABFS16_09575 [Bacteroidota bacterium]